HLPREVIRAEVCIALGYSQWGSEPRTRSARCPLGVRRRGSEPDAAQPERHLDRLELTVEREPLAAALAFIRADVPKAHHAPAPGPRDAGAGLPRPPRARR